MKMKLMTIALMSILTICTDRPTLAQPKPNQIAPSISFGSGRSVFGLDSRFPLTSHLSLRPSVRFPSGGAVIGTSVSYDFDPY